MFSPYTNTIDEAVAFRQTTLLQNDSANSSDLLSRSKKTHSHGGYALPHQSVIYPSNPGTAGPELATGGMHMAIAC